MAKFKKGDKVVRCAEWRMLGDWPSSGRDLDVLTVVRCSDSQVIFEGLNTTWNPDRFELYVEPQPEPVTVTEPPVQQIPGVPDGYRLVRIGAPKKGEYFINAYNTVIVADSRCYDLSWAIVEPIVPPAPPTPIPSTVKVQLNRYLVGEVGCAGSSFLVVCTQEYVENWYPNYRLLGPSETLELEVEV